MGTKISLRDTLASDKHRFAPHVGDLAAFVRAGIAESLYLKSWRT